MFNLNYLYHLPQFIIHNPMNSNSIFIFREIVGHIFQRKSAERLQKLVLIEFKNFFAAFYAKQGLLIQTLICKTLFTVHINFFRNLNFFWENLIFDLCPNLTRFSKNIFICKDWTFKKIIFEGRGFWCGSDEKMRSIWLGLGIVAVGHPPLAGIKHSCRSLKHLLNQQVIHIYILTSF